LSLYFLLGLDIDISGSICSLYSSGKVFIYRLAWRVGLKAIVEGFSSCDLTIGIASSRPGSAGNLFPLLLFGETVPSAPFSKLKPVALPAVPTVFVGETLFE
jgi:hypothetical protein